MLRHAVRYILTDVSGELALIMEAVSSCATSVHIYQITQRYIAMNHRPDGGSTHPWNVGRHSIKNTVVHPRRFWASYFPPWELEISLDSCHVRVDGVRPRLWTATSNTPNYCRLIIALITRRWFKIHLWRNGCHHGLKLVSAFPVIIHTSAS
jgi:hypothetical protein